MTDSVDDDSPFWAERWSTRTPRRFERTRSHRVVQPAVASFDDFAPEEDWADDWDEVDVWVEADVQARSRAVGVDAKLYRLGVGAAAAVVMIPLAIGLGGGGSGEGMRSRDVPVSTSPVSSTSTTAAIIMVPVTAGATVPPTVVPAPRAAAATASVAAPVAVAPVATEPPCAGTYTVIFNDSWLRFPRTSGASVEEWLAANDATIATPLYVGDELCIPLGAQAPAAPPATTAVPETTAAPTVATTAVPTAPPPTSPPPTSPPPSTSPPSMAPVPPPAAAPSVTAAAPLIAPPRSAPPAPASVEAIIREIWPDDLEERALTIARRESGLRPDAYNGHCCYGLFQIYFEANRGFLATLGITSSAQLLDARTNVIAAFAIYQRSGWRPWSQTDPG